MADHFHARMERLKWSCARRAESGTAARPFGTHHSYDLRSSTRNDGLAAVKVLPLTWLTVAVSLSPVGYHPQGGFNVSASLEFPLAVRQLKQQEPS